MENTNLKILTLLFHTDNWTMEKAKKWVKDHEDKRIIFSIGEQRMANTIACEECNCVIDLDLVSSNFGFLTCPFCGKQISYIKDTED